MARRVAKEKALVLRGANGLFYKIPRSVLERYLVAPEDLDGVLRELREHNPELAEQAVTGGPWGAGSQVVINVFTSSAGPVVRYGTEEAALRAGINPQLLNVPRGVSR